MQVIALYINVLAYVFMLLYYIKNSCLNKVNIITGIYFLYLLSSVMGIIHFYSDFSLYENITIFPFVLMCFYLNIFTYPLYKYTQIENRKSSIILYSNNSFIKYLSYVLLIINIIPFVENIQALINGLDNYGMSTYLSDIHDFRQEGDTTGIFQYTLIGSICFKLTSFAYEISFLVLFYLFTRPAINKLSMLSFLLNILNYNLYAFLVSGRSTLVYTMLQLIFMFFLFKKQLPNKRKRLIIKISFLIFALVSSLFLFITISRLIVNPYMNFSLFEFISWYAGEGMLNLNEYIFNSRCATEGDYTAPFIKEIMGFDTFSENYLRRNYWQSKTGIPQHIFYTFIGNFILDYGLFFTFVIFVLISILVAKTIEFKNNKYYPLYKLIPIIIIVNIATRGFCFFTYAGVTGNKVLLQTIMWYFIFKFFSKDKPWLEKYY